MKTRSAIVSGALLTTGMALGAVFSPIGFASAQEDDGSTTDTPTPDAPESEEGENGRHGRHGRRGEAVAEIIGITVEDLRAGFEADKSLAEIAGENGMSEADLVAALTDKANERLDEAVANERLTAEEADEKRADVAERIAEGVNTKPSERPEREGRRHHIGRKLGVGEALEGLGLTQDQIREGFQAGNTLAETAEAAGVSEDALVGAIVAEATERIEGAVEDGNVDADRAEELLGQLEERITERVNSEPGERGGHGRRGGPAQDQPSA